MRIAQINMSNLSSGTATPQLTISVGVAEVFGGATMAVDRGDSLASDWPQRKRDEREMQIGTSEHSSWGTFVHKFEQFTDVLCVAAQFGVDDRLDQRYRSLRAWFTEHYYHHTSRLRPHLGSDDRGVTTGGHALDAASRMDRFEAIFLPRSLAELLAHDDGNLISLVSDVSRAVYAVRE
jgi:hypothetical protein